METRVLVMRRNRVLRRRGLYLTVFVIAITVQNTVTVNGKVATFGYPVGVFSTRSADTSNAQRSLNYGSSSRDVIMSSRPGYLYINGQRFIENSFPPRKTEFNKIRDAAELLKKRRRRLYRTRPLSRPQAMFGQNYQKPEIHFPKLSRTLHA